MKEKALVVFHPDCIEFEAILAAQVIHEEDLAIDVATADGKDFQGSSGIALRATHSYADVDPTEYRVVIAPGGDTTRKDLDETRKKREERRKPPRAPVRPPKGSGPKLPDRPRLPE